MQMSWQIRSPLWLPRRRASVSSPVASPKPPKRSPTAGATGVESTSTPKAAGSLCGRSVLGLDLDERADNIDSYRAEARAMLLAGIYALHRDPDLGEFAGSRSGPISPRNSAGRGRWQYLPVGAGLRSSIGDQIAMLEAIPALATIVQRTEICSLQGNFPLIVPFTPSSQHPSTPEYTLTQQLDVSCSAPEMAGVGVALFVE
jgi:hypothetical protein